MLGPGCCLKPWGVLDGCSTECGLYPQGQVKKSPRGLLTLQVSWVHELSSPLSPRLSQGKTAVNTLRDAWIGACPHKVPSPIRASVTGSDLGSSQLSS